ncbi:MAG TPA: ribonuclease HII [Ktedonobacteraceae bacterium]|nr:ribonuclease HII [Ktedonobacteraceae bacterium]
MVATKTHNASVPPALPAFPTLEEEMALLSQGYSFIAGLDEAGRGCLAGPVVASAVILPISDETLAVFDGVRDSKQLSMQARERLYDVIMEHALAVGVGSGSVELIDQINILQATKHAMRVALTQLFPQPHALLLDALLLHDIALPQRSIIKGDARCLSIAAASIIAKVTRDRLMCQLHQQYPLYGFDQHKGYGTPAHLEALNTHGASPIHRTTFSPVKEMLFGLFSTSSTDME